MKNKIMAAYEHSYQNTYLLHAHMRLLHSITAFWRRW